MSDWIDFISQELNALDSHHLLRKRRIVRPLSATELIVDGDKLLAFCSNDYLGLSKHPRLIQAAQACASNCGLGSTASPLVCGHSEENNALELELAHFVGLESALYFYAGFALNAGVIPALVGLGDEIYSDSLNHACLIDGARLSKASIRRYKHLDYEELEDLLKTSQAGRKLIISDCVFSMDGDIVNLSQLALLAKRYNALLLVDDAHGFGLRGPQGRGSLAAENLIGSHAQFHILYMATLGKAAGVAGGFIAGSSLLIQWLLQKTRSYIFATAAPPLLAAALRESIKLIEHQSSLRFQLQHNIQYLKDHIQPVLSQNDWYLLPSDTPIQPLVIGSNRAALDVMKHLHDHGIWVPAIRPPTVPMHTARLRIALSAAHTSTHIDRLINTLLSYKGH